MRRQFTTLYGILSLVAWLVYAPFFHVHTSGEGGDAHAHLGVLDVDHDHDADNDTDSDTDHHDDPHDSDHHDVGPELDTPHHGHHGVQSSAFAGGIPPAGVILAEVSEAFRMAEPPVLQGTVPDQTVRVHDPPALRFSNPRSPPV